MTEQNNKNTCLCGKIYKTRSGLWKHKNKCTFNPDEKDVPKVLQEEESSIDKLNQRVSEIIERENTHLQIIQELIQRDSTNLKIIQKLCEQVKTLEEEKEQERQTTIAASKEVQYMTTVIEDLWNNPKPCNKCN
jgi:aspartokinase|uniref:Uncharacterized protein n=1 Tax=viral metagenome TaxID=1070528 RepID=A0A6C0IJT9_9ZZZZ